VSILETLWKNNLNFVKQVPITYVHLIVTVITITYVHLIVTVIIVSEKKNRKHYFRTAPPMFITV